MLTKLSANCSVDVGEKSIMSMPHRNEILLFDNISDLNLYDFFKLILLLDLHIKIPRDLHSETKREISRKVFSF